MNSAIKVKINRAEFNEQVCSLRGAALESKVSRIVKEEYFYPAVYEMIDEFENHPVTKEIEGGVDSENLSDTLRGKFKNESGKNLFSFIGFLAGTNPIAQIRQFFDPKHKNGPKCTLESTEKKRLLFNFKITPPDIEAIYKTTPIPWASGMSWVRRMEIGIPGLGRFLNKIGAKNSRSGGGVQIKHELRSARFSPVQYMTGIFNNFIKNVSKK